MFEILNNICEYLKKNTELIYIFIVQLFVRNSTPWFNLKNLVKLISFCLKKFLRVLVFIITAIPGMITQFLTSAKEGFQQSVLLILILQCLILLKLHHAGIIKLSSTTVIAMSACILIFGLASVISKMEFTKIDSAEAELNN